MTTITTEDLTPLAKELDILFDGNLNLAANNLDELLYMLFHLDKDVFHDSEITSRAYELKHLIKALRASDNEKSSLTEHEKQHFRVVNLDIDKSKEDKLKYGAFGPLNLFPYLMNYLKAETGKSVYKNIQPFFKSSALLTSLKAIEKNKVVNSTFATIFDDETQKSFCKQLEKHIKKKQLPETYLLLSRLLHYSNHHRHFRILEWQDKKLTEEQHWIVRLLKESLYTLLLIHSRTINDIDSQEGTTNRDTIITIKNLKSGIASILPISHKEMVEDIIVYMTWNLESDNSRQERSEEEKMLEICEAKAYTLLAFSTYMKESTDFMD